MKLRFGYLTGILVIPLVAIAVNAVITEGSSARGSDAPLSTQQEIAGESWTGDLTFTAVDSNNNPLPGGTTLGFGVKLGATDGFDLGLDALSPPTPSAPYIDPYFFYTNNPTTPVDQRELRVSITSTGDFHEWPTAIDCFTGSFNSATAAVTITWDVSTIPIGKKVELLNGNKSFLADMRITTSYQFNLTAPLLAGGSAFYVRVTSQSSFVSPPVLVTPADNATLPTNTALFDWEPSNLAVVSYRLQVTSGDINTGPYDIDVVVVHPITEATGDLVDGVYQWRVIARDAALNPAPSETRTFTVGAVCQFPTQIVAAGWTLIGWICDAPGDPATIAGALGGTVRIYGYDPATPANPWSIYDSAAPPFVNTLSELIQWRGYWIFSQS